MYNSYKNNAIELEPRLIRGRIDNIKLRFIYLGEKRTSITITLHAKAIVNKFFFWFCLAKMPHERTVIKIGIDKAI